MIFYLFGIFIYVVPGLWVNYTLNKHDDILPNMPFTAKEFGLNLLKEQDLESASNYDMVIIHTPHTSFHNIDFENFKSLIFDTTGSFTISNAERI